MKLDWSMSVSGNSTHFYECHVGLTLSAPKGAIDTGGDASRFPFNDSQELAACKSAMRKAINDLPSCDELSKNR